MDSFLPFVTLVFSRLSLLRTGLYRSGPRLSRPNPLAGRGGFRPMRVTIPGRGVDGREAAGM